MSGTYRLKKAGFALLASLMMTTAIPAYAQVDNFNNPVPEVEVDGSALQQLEPSAGNGKALAPIQLTAPSVNRKATSGNGPMLTDTLDNEPADDKSAAIVPSLTAPDDGENFASAPPQKIAKEELADEPVVPIITTSAAPKIIKPLTASTRPGAISSRPVDIAEDRPVQIIPKITESPAPVVTEIAPKPILKISPQQVVNAVEEPIIPLITETPAPVVAKVEPQPVLKVVPAPIITAVEEPITPKITEAPAPVLAKVEPKPAPKIANAPVIAAVEKTVIEKPIIPVIVEKPAAAPVVAAVAVPVLAPKPAPVVAAVAPAAAPKLAAKTIPKPDNSFVTQVVMDVPGVPLPATPLNPVPKAEVAAAKPIIIPPMKSQEREDKILTTPPKAMAEVNVKAATTKPVSFPITSTSKTRGEIDPSPLVEAKTQVIPNAVIAEQKKPETHAMAKPAEQADLSPVVALSTLTKNTEPEIIYRNVPTPKPRPNVIVASKDFVERARRSYEDTYTVVKRDGDQMPAVKNQKVAREDLPQGKVSAARISVADIAGDPLASKLVSMSPDDIASTLNNIRPAAGDATSRSTEFEEVRTNQRIRIVRENGNWKPRKPADATQQMASMNDLGDAPTAKPSADGRYNIAFKTGATDLPSASFGEVDSGVVSALKSDSNARVQIVAYASAADGKDTTAKRTSLARALSLRSYLISKGIDATRMDVRAMGVQQDSKAAQDQVEMILLTADSAKKS